MNLPRRLVLASFLVAAACATTDDNRPLVHPLELELREFQQRQEVFRAQNIGPFDFEFADHGRVTVREILLDGFPGHTYLKCRFHYQNRTKAPVMQAWVSLDVLDAQERVVSTQSCHLIVPFAIGRGAYYSDELRTPTYTAHLKPGWSWRIRCHADLETEEEPLDPPVEEPPVLRQHPPMYIKDRNWPYPTYRS